jgi:hypothetical protein
MYAFNVSGKKLLTCCRRSSRSLLTRKITGRAAEYECSAVSIDVEPVPVKRVPKPPPAVSCAVAGELQADRPALAG